MTSIWNYFFNNMDDKTDDIQFRLEDENYDEEIDENEEIDEIPNTVVKRIYIINEDWEPTYYTDTKEKAKKIIRELAKRYSQSLEISPHTRTFIEQDSENEVYVKKQNFSIIISYPKTIKQYSYKSVKSIVNLNI